MIGGYSTTSEFTDSTYPYSTPTIFFVEIRRGDSYTLLSDMFAHLATHTNPPSTGFVVFHRNEIDSIDCSLSHSRKRIHNLKCRLFTSAVLGTRRFAQPGEMWPLHHPKIKCTSSVVNLALNAENRR